MILSPYERRVLRAIGQTMFPRGGAIDADAHDADVVSYIDDYLSRLPTWDRWQLRAFFRAFDLGFAAWCRNPMARFHTAHPDDRRDYLSSWEHSPRYTQRMGFQGLRMVFTFAWAESDAVKAGMGMIPPAGSPGGIAGTRASIDDELKKLARLNG